LATLDAQAKALAREVFDTEADRHHGVRYLTGQGLALVFHNEPPREDPVERFDEIQKFRDWLHQSGILVVTAAGYPSRGAAAGHTTVFLVRAIKAHAAPIQEALDRLCKTPKQRAISRQILCANGIEPIDAIEEVWNPDNH